MNKQTVIVETEKYYLPVFGRTGIWLATPATELMAIALACFMFLKYKNKYRF